MNNDLFFVGVTKSNTTHELDTTNPFNKWVVFVFNMQTRLTRLAYKIINYFDVIA